MDKINLFYLNSIEVEDLLNNEVFIEVVMEIFEKVLRNFGGVKEGIYMIDKVEVISVSKTIVLN